MLVRNSYVAGGSIVIEVSEQFWLFIYPEFSLNDVCISLFNSRVGRSIPVL